MAKKRSGYEELLRKVAAEPMAFQAPAYRWNEVDPLAKGEKQVLFGLCRACMQGDCATLIHLEEGVVVRLEGNPDAPPN